MVFAEVLICCLIGYALGNINPSYFFARKKGYDVRKDGSGNAGASNALILAGKSAFFVTALMDIFKAYLACRICRVLFPSLSVAPQLGGVACILGHMFPALLRFRGGKGLACLGGVILAWSWQWFFLLLLLAAMVAFVTRYVCVVAPAFSVIFPACYVCRTGEMLAALILLIPAIPIFAKHWENFRRIREGTELRMSYLWNKDEELRRIGR